MEAEWTVVVHEAAEGGYWAEVEELPGCFASGDTRDELEADLQGAIETYLTAVDEISTGEDAVGTDEKGSPRPRPGEGAPMPLSQEFPNYRERRRELRQNATLAENLLWRQLRRKQFEGFKFRRQHQLGPYIADFYCSEARLVIEVDGGQHFDAGAEKYDQERTGYFESRGIRVLRFTNTDVTRNLGGIGEAILEALGAPSP